MKSWNHEITKHRTPIPSHMLHCYIFSVGIAIANNNCYHIKYDCRTQINKIAWYFSRNYRNVPYFVIVFVSHLMYPEAINFKCFMYAWLGCLIKYNSSFLECGFLFWSFQRQGSCLSIFACLAQTQNTEHRQSDGAWHIDRHSVFIVM